MLQEVAISNECFNLIFVLIIYLLDVYYILDIVLKEITKINPHSNAERYVCEETKVKMVSHQLFCLKIAHTQNHMFQVKI